MANRPRLPNVDPADLERLANQYPGSASRGGVDASQGVSGSAKPQPQTQPGEKMSAEAPKSSTEVQTTGNQSMSSDTVKSPSSTGASSAAGASTEPKSSLSSASPSPAPSVGPSGLSAGGLSAAGAGGGSASGGGAGAGAAQPPSAPKRRGSWFATFWTLIFAVIALAAAVFSLGAPSYRSEVRLLLLEHVPQLNERTVNLVTGYDTDRLEVTYEGLDARIDRLTQALERVVATEGLTQDAARELLLRDEMAAKLDDVDARLNALSGVTGEVTEQLPVQQATIEAMKAEMASEVARLDGELTSASESLTASVDALKSELAGAQDALRSDLMAAQEAAASLGQRSDTIEASIAESAEAQSALVGRTAAIEARAETLTNDFKALLDVHERTAELVLMFQSENMPVLALLQLQGAVADSKPFSEELTFAKTNLNAAVIASPAFDMLTKFSVNGVNSIQDLRRDLRLIAAQSNSISNRASNWGAQFGQWLSMLIGAVASPQPALVGGIEAAAETIENALERGDLELAVAEASVMITDSRSGALNDWLVGLRDRHQLYQAMQSLEAAVYGRAATDQGMAQKSN